MWKRFLTWLDEILEAVFHGDVNQAVKQPIKPTEAIFVPMDVTPNPEPPMTISHTKVDALYDLSKSLLGQHLSLNEAVPWIVGCAEAVSKLLVEFGVIGIPPKGIEGTAALAEFLSKSKQFQEIYTYTPGAVIVSATGSGNGKVRGHTGVCGRNSIMSNNSATGNWEAHWDIHRWQDYYGVYGGIPTRYFLPV